MTALAAQRAYWNQGTDAVPVMTGAASVLDCADVRAICEQLGVALPFTGSVLDVGCGTGRLAQVCAGGYLGVDIASDAVRYCRRRGLQAVVIDGPKGIGRTVWDVILCLSVFTHMSRDDRQAYLRAFNAGRLLVDVIPGDGSGAIALWSADWDDFQQDLTETGWEIASGPVDRRGPSGPLHRYVWARPR